MKNTTHALTLNLAQPDRPLPESWRRAALHIIRTQVQPALRSMAEGQSIVVAGERARSPQIEVVRLPARSFPWLARVKLNADTVMFVGRRTLRVAHRGVTYQTSLQASYRE